MDPPFCFESEQDPVYSVLIMISSDEDETFGEGVSIISLKFEENMMDVEAQLLAMNIDAQLSTPVTVRGRQMTLESQDERASTSLPLCCGGPYSDYRPLGSNDSSGTMQQWEMLRETSTH